MKERVEDRPGSASAALQDARAQVAALLADVERLRPGLALHRSLDVQGGDGVRAQALCESFGECDALCATPDAVRLAEGANRHPGRCRYLHSAEQELSFPDETFDLVHCGTLSGDAQDGERVVGEALRVLRLRGVAVVDLAAAGPASPAPDNPFGAVRLLVGLPVLQSATQRAGETRQIAVTITNAGARVLGSTLAPLRLQARWRQPDGESGVAGEALLDGFLLPGERKLMRLPVAATGALAVHLLELSLLEGGSWGERRIAATTLAVPVGVGDRAGLGDTRDPAPPGVDRRVCAAVAGANGVMLGAHALDARTDLESRARYFFARA